MKNFIIWVGKQLSLKYSSSLFDPWMNYIVNNALPPKYLIDSIQFDLLTINFTINYLLKTSLNEFKQEYSFILKNLVDIDNECFRIYIKDPFSYKKKFAIKLRSETRPIFASAMHHANPPKKTIEW